MSSTETLEISFDATSRNYLVTSSEDEGAGSLRDAVSSASSGDVITFALEQYPATIRLKSKIEFAKNIIGADLR